MRLTKLQELTTITESSSGGFFTEAKGYNDASEFTDEFYDLFAQVTKMKKVMKNPKWIEYMKLSDMRLDTQVEDPARSAIRAIVALEDALQVIDKEFDRANGHEDNSDPDELQLDPEFEEDEDTK